MNVTIEGKRWVNLNGSHGNQHAHQALMDEWKARAILAIRQAYSVAHVVPPVTITATIRRTVNRPADAHNVTPTIKACIDALVSCGVIEDDHDGIVSALIIRGGPKAKVPTVEIEVRSAS